MIFFVHLVMMNDVVDDPLNCRHAQDPRPARTGPFLFDFINANVI